MLRFTVCSHCYKVILRLLTMARIIRSLLYQEICGVELQNKIGICKIHMFVWVREWSSDLQVPIGTPCSL